MRKRNNKTRKKIILLCFVFAFVLISLFIFFLHCSSNKEKEFSKRLVQMAADEKALQLNMFFEHQLEILDVLRSMPAFQEAAMYPDDQEKLMDLEKISKSLKSLLPGVTLLTPEGIVIFSGFNPRGADYSSHSYFSSGELYTGFDMYYDPFRRNYYYAVGGPIYSPYDEGEVIGVIVFNVELEKIDKLIENSVMYENKEIYIINQNGLLLSSSKYTGDEKASRILIQEVKSKGAKECLEKTESYGHHFASRYVNYLGQDVFGFHSRLDSINGCVIAEIELDKPSYPLISGMFSYFY